MEKMKVFFWFCSGANMAILKKCPTETNKYIGVGGTVFFTGILAALSAGYALYTVFENWYWGLVFGLVWGVMIFNLDRFIVSSMRKKKNSWAEWKLAFPRLLLAVFLAMVISKPLELKVFEKEINQKVSEQKVLEMEEAKGNLDAVYPEVARLEAENQQLRDEMAAKAAFRDQVQKEYDEERFGVKTPGTTGVVGLGSNAEKKEEQLDAAQQDLDRVQERNWAKIDKNEQEMAVVMTRRERAFERQQASIDEFDGLAARMHALSQLTGESQAVYWANIFIMLLFVAMETAPVVVKLMAGRGPYDEMLDKSERAVKLYTDECNYKSQAESTHRIRVFDEVIAAETVSLIEKKLHRNEVLTKAEMKLLEERLKDTHRFQAQHATGNKTADH
ncbi:DUF4407 domain-containing protein [Echinicola strongylocentroti]|uniref:DUF4407 domain-containing protein n=1 Tax=Echinicola strongylocentroti TaxID=1795355 RepID=A0A2Z4ILV2_9BACT|nr:DUF4407 domain-containing protein [Echinicola strongylocentroti]AWW31700.1 DUF4407 domain-containing protein [Echinicola strongylocentroti]